MSTTVVQIPDKAAHDAIVAESASTPTVIYVSNSSLPACKAFTPQYEELASKHATIKSGDAAKIQFCQLDFNHKTSMLFKFAPNQLPIVVLMCNDRYCKTVLAPRIAEVEKEIEILRIESGKTRC